MSETAEGTDGRDGLADKQFYHELTDLQQDIIDYRAKNPGSSNSEVADEVGCSKWSVSTVTNKYSDILAEREIQVNNSHEKAREAGNVRVEGEIDLTDEEEWPKPQMFEERPHGDGGGPDTNTDRDADDREHVTLTLPLETVFGIVSGTATPQERRAVFEEVARD